MADKEQNTLETEEATPDSETSEHTEMAEVEDSVNVVVLSAEEFVKKKISSSMPPKILLRI